MDSKSKNKRINLVYTASEESNLRRYLGKILGEGLILNDGTLKLKGKPLAEYLMLHAAKILDPDFKVKIGEQQPKEIKGEEIISKTTTEVRLPENASSIKTVKRMAPPTKERVQDVQNKFGLSD